ncbi:alpha/beta fold hydrolase [Chthonobacter albigriseus]|uniref:alpha/beta fold hydrolase n=1 Tax=Chthonobacter albigriseus TaxID=1683161 RepID=UPI0015EF9DC7
MSGREFSWTGEDGTRLAGRIFGPDPDPAGPLPVLCLPGLTRNGRDFTVLAEALSTGDRPRTVITMDFRGRGRSSYADPATYRPDMEAKDTLAGLDALGIPKVAIVGTSRGGIVAMVIAATAGDRLGRVVLNDIGPVIEIGGLLAIRERMGQMLGHQVASWDDAIADLKATMGRSFTRLADADWLTFARQMYREDGNGVPVLDYDPALLTSFATFDSAVGIPPFWPIFLALGARPVLVVRGVNSDLLSEETVADMVAKLPQTEVHRVPDQGHAPLLTDVPTIERIRTFLAT